MKTNDEIDEMIKEYIYESPDGGKTVYRREMGETDRELVDTNPIIDLSDVYVSNNPSDYIDLISLDTDTIDVSSLTTMVDPYIFNDNQDVTMKVDGKERSMRDLFSTVDAIKDRLAILEPKQELLDKYELLQSLYEQYKAAEAMLSGPDIEDKEEESPF